MQVEFCEKTISRPASCPETGHRKITHEKGKIMAAAKTPAKTDPLSISADTAERYPNIVAMVGLLRPVTVRNPDDCDTCGFRPGDYEHYTQCLASA